MFDDDSGKDVVRFAGLLALLFIALKLTHVIDWSWWWVVSPLWIMAILFGIATVIITAYEDNWFR